MLALFTFIGTWTNFFWPFIVLGPSNPTLPVALQRFASQRLGKDVIDIEDVDLARGERVLLQHATWRLGPGDRVALRIGNGLDWVLARQGLTLIVAAVAEFVHAHRCGSFSMTLVSREARAWCRRLSPGRWPSPRARSRRRF